MKKNRRLTQIDANIENNEPDQSTILIFGMRTR